MQNGDIFLNKLSHANFLRDQSQQLWMQRFALTLQSGSAQALTNSSRRFRPEAGASPGTAENESRSGGGALGVMAKPFGLRAEPLGVRAKPGGARLLGGNTDSVKLVGAATGILWCDKDMSIGVGAKATSLPGAGTRAGDIGAEPGAGAMVSRPGVGVGAMF